MDKKNPFDSPQSALPTKSSRPISIAIGTVLGGLAGLLLEVIGVMVLFAVIPGMPSIFQMWFLLVFVAVLLVVPCSAIGTFAVLFINRRAKKWA